MYVSVLKSHITESSFLLQTQKKIQKVYLIKGLSIKSSQLECLSFGGCFFLSKSILADFCKYNYQI